MKIWLLVVTIYTAPSSNAVDWDGPWNFGMARAGSAFKSEAECRNSAIQLIAKMHEGMLAPMRFACVPFDAALPKGAPR
jgi:hypothetical protein